LSVIVKSKPAITDYIEVLKPKETSLLVFIGVCSSLVAASSVHGSFPVSDFIICFIAILLGSAGANGLTNYLDRDVDSRMRRTCNRALAARRIYPANKALPLIIGLISAGLILSWILSPICFAIGLIGVISSGIFRKTIACTFLGIVAGSAPILIGWYAIMKQPEFNLLPLLYFCMIALWTPLHVWTLMMSYRQDYERAGLHYFPLFWKDKQVIVLLAILSFALSAIALAIYFVTNMFSWIFGAVALVLSIIMIIANIRLLLYPTSQNAWRVYRLSAFPYLGIIFATMALDVWLV
jgi:protoheme IX farnesyltransferase